MQISSDSERNVQQPPDTLNKTLVIACGAIAHELVALMKVNDWQHWDLQCLPAEWHNSPERISPAVDAKIIEYRQRYAKVFVAYADCGTGGHLDKVLTEHGVERLPGDHCYSFFAGVEVFNAMAEKELGTFYLTDYLVDNFQRLILDGLGISRHPELLEQYFGNYTQLMYLRQDTDSPKCDKRLQLAQKAAAALDLQLCVHDTGLEPFARSLGGCSLPVDSASGEQHISFQRRISSDENNPHFE